MAPPILLGEGVSKDRIQLTKVAELTSFRAAKAFGLYLQRGALEVGSDGDKVIVDMSKRMDHEARGRFLPGFPRQPEERLP